jgi:hypothetical protein
MLTDLERCLGHIAESNPESTMRFQLCTIIFLNLHRSPFSGSAEECQQGGWKAQ